MKIHIGCGKRNFGEDWIHIDGSDYDHVKYHDIINLPTEKNTVDIIYASHVFEYFDREQAITVLKKWMSYLKQDGIIRLAVPNFEIYSKLYYDKIFNLDNCLGPLYGKWKMNDKITLYHKTTYDYNSLELLLNNVGLKNVRLWNWREVEHCNMDDYSQSYYPHLDKNNGVLLSLNVECNKSSMI